MMLEVSQEDAAVLNAIQQVSESINARKGIKTLRVFGSASDSKTGDSGLRGTNWRMPKCSRDITNIRRLVNTARRLNGMLRRSKIGG